MGGVWGRGVGRGGRGKVSENTAGRVSGAQGGVGGWGAVRSEIRCGV